MGLLVRWLSHEEGRGGGGGAVRNLWSMERHP